MKILITERQLKLLVENVTLDTILSKLKIRDTIQFSVGKVSGEPFKYIFKVVEDAGDSWKMINMNVGSTNTGFDFYLDKNTKISNSQLPMIKVSQKKGGQSDGTIKNIVSVKLGKNILYVAKTGAEVSKNDVKQSYDIAIQNLKNSKPEMDPEVANDAALAIVKQEFGDIPVAEIIDTAGYGKINKDGKGGKVGAKDVDSVDVPKAFTIDNIKSKFVEGSGIKLTLENDDELDFNVISGSGDAFMIELIKTNSEEYNEYEEVQFNVKLTPNNIELGPDGKYFNMNISIATTTAATRPVVIEYIVNIDKTKKFDDDIELSKKDLLRIIMGNPVLKNAFTNTPTLMGLINIGDVRGISKAYDILNRSGFDVGDSNDDGGKNQDFAGKFSSDKSEISLERDVDFVTGNKIKSGKKVVTVSKRGKKITLYDADKNSYGLLEELPNDIYRVSVKRNNESGTSDSKIRVLDYKFRG
jgi:hypothetical protein